MASTRISLLEVYKEYFRIINDKKYSSVHTLLPKGKRHGGWKRD